MRAFQWHRPIPQFRSWPMAIALAAMALGLTACSTPEEQPADEPMATQPLDLDPKPRSDRPGAFRHLLDKLTPVTTKEEVKTWADQAFDGGDLYTAAELYVQAFDRGMADPATAYRTGWAWQEIDPARAIFYYDFCIASDADNWDAYFNRANCYFALNRLRDRSYPDPDANFAPVHTGEPKPLTLEVPRDSRNPNDRDRQKYTFDVYEGKVAEVVTEHGALHYYTELIELQKQANLKPYVYAYFNRAYCYYLVGDLDGARLDFIQFYQDGGSLTPYADRALTWIARIEDTKSLPQSQRFNPMPASQP